MSGEYKRKRKKNKMGRAMGIIMGIKKEIMEKATRIETEEERIIVERVRNRKEKLENSRSLHD